MNLLSNKLIALQQELAQSQARLVAVSKYYPNEKVMEAYQTGQRIFGESRLQELSDKVKSLPHDIEWHFIGHLQTNKIKQLLPLVALIHGVDSLRLVDEIERQAERLRLRPRILLQLHVAQEETKFGFATDELLQLFRKGHFSKYKHLSICGLMCMASNTDHQEQIRQEFRSVKTLFNQLIDEQMVDPIVFRELSMGMSGDYHTAIEEGSTLVRIGSLIFG